MALSRGRGRLSATWRLASRACSTAGLDGDATAGLYADATAGIYGDAMAGIYGDPTAGIDIDSTEFWYRYGP